MARIVVSSYLVRFPLGGYFSWVLHWLIGFQRLGHEVYYVEKSGWQNSCYDPWKNVASEDCSYGTATLNLALGRYGLEHNWSFADAQGRYHGLSREQIAAVFRSADLYLDMGMHEWREEAALAKLRVVVDGEPAYTQMQWEEGLAEGEILPVYDHYFTVGRNIGTDAATAPTAGKQWRPIFDPVNVELMPFHPVKAKAPFTTVMSWQAHDEIEFGGKTYGQKDVEFEKFFDLPGRTKVPLEIAVGGAGRDNVPTHRLRQAGWCVRSSLTVSRTYEVFMKYIQNSKGEFSVCKNVFVATNSGFFSERSAAYLACGRPVVMQETGFSAHLPCGQGLFAVRTADEAAAAIEEINRDCQRQSQWARELAFAHLDTAKVLGGFLVELGFLIPVEWVSVIKTHVYNSFDEPALSAAQWNALLGVSDTDVIFLTWHWQRAWWETVGRGQLLLIAAERAGAIIAIAPLYAECGMVYFVGSGNSDYLDFIGDISDPQILTALLATATECVPDLVGFRLYCIPEQSRTGSRLQAAAERLGLVCYVEETWPAPQVHLAEQREAVLAAVNGSSLRKRECYYRKRGVLELRQSSDGEMILPQLEQFFAQHRSQWGESDYGNPAFLTRLTQVAALTGWLRFSRLDWEGRPIAFEYGWRYRDTYFGGPSCFAGDLARRSPGQVLLRQLLLAACAEGLSKYDLGIGDEPYKLRYATNINCVHTWGLYSPALLVDS